MIANQIAGIVMLLHDIKKRENPDRRENPAVDSTESKESKFNKCITRADLRDAGWRCFPHVYARTSRIARRRS